MSPVFRDREKDKRPAASDQPQLRFVLDDETVERLQAAAAAYGMDVEELMVALIQAGSERIADLLGEPPSTRRAN